MTKNPVIRFDALSEGVRAYLQRPGGYFSVTFDPKGSVRLGELRTVLDAPYPAPTPPDVVRELLIEAVRADGGKGEIYTLAEVAADPDPRPGWRGSAPMMTAAEFARLDPYDRPRALRNGVRVMPEA